MITLTNLHLVIALIVSIGTILKWVYNAGRNRGRMEQMLAMLKK